MAASSHAAIGSRQPANLGRDSGVLATTPPLTGLPLGVVAKEGLVKLLPVFPTVNTDKLPQGVLVATLQSERPQHPLNLFQRSVPLGLGLAVERGVECHRDPDRQQPQAQPHPKQLQNHEQHDQDCQGRCRREPFRKSPGRHEAAQTLRNNGVFRLIPTSTKSATAVHNPRLANTPAPIKRPVSRQRIARREARGENRR